MIGLVEDEPEIEMDDEDEDDESLLKMDTSCLLELKSDPNLEKHIDDDSSSTDSDDSTRNELNELEAKYLFIKQKIEACRGMNKLILINFFGWR